MKKKEETVDRENAARFMLYLPPEIRTSIKRLSAMSDVSMHEWILTAIKKQLVKEVPSK